jgi:hypothetical protein
MDQFIQLVNQTIINQEYYQNLFKIFIILSDIIVVLLLYLNRKNVRQEHLCFKIWPYLIHTQYKHQSDIITILKSIRFYNFYIQIG